MDAGVTRTCCSDFWIIFACVQSLLSALPHSYRLATPPPHSTRTAGRSRGLRDHWWRKHEANGNHIYVHDATSDVFRLFHFFHLAFCGTVCPEMRLLLNLQSPRHFYSYNSLYRQLLTNKVPRIQESDPLALNVWDATYTCPPRRRDQSRSLGYVKQHGVSYLL